MRIFFYAVGLSGIVFSCSLAVLADGRQGKQTGSRTPSQQTESRRAEHGAVLYRLHCAPCHGKSGRGDGPLAADLEAESSDLTRISERNDGRFPREALTRVIDGRTEIEAHGSREMPIWGLSLRQEERLQDQEEEVWLQIQDLVTYLESIQRAR